MIKGVPAEGGCRFDNFMERPSFRLAITDRFARSQAAAQNFAHQQTTAGDLGNQALTDNVANRVGQAVTDLLFFILGEKANDAIDRLAGVDRVERAEDKVAGFGGGERDFHRLAIANFADQDHFWRLTQRRAQPIRESADITAEPAMTDGCASMRMKKFNRVLQGYDVNRLR